MANLEKIIELIKRTGDRCIIIDSHGNPAYVALSFDEYNKLIAGSSNLAELSEDEMLDKINRDVATWRASQQEQQLKDWDSLENAIQETKGGKTEVQEAENSLNKEENQDKENQYYFEPIE